MRRPRPSIKATRCATSSGALLSTYPVPEYYDAHGDELARVPYTPWFYAALGTAIARAVASRAAAPYKVVVLDCDQDGQLSARDSHTFGDEFHGPQTPKRIDVKSEADLASVP